MWDLGKKITTFWFQFIRLLDMQLSLLLLSFPILLWWGLPISVMVLIATSLFSPFLTAFLLIATLIFLTFLIHIHFYPLFYALDCVTKVWMTCLKYSDPHWMIPIVMPQGIFIAAMMSFNFWFLFTTRGWQERKRVILFISYFALTLLFLWGYQAMQRKRVEYVHAGKFRIAMIITGAGTILIDEGVFSRKKSYISWIQYTLLPELIKHTGSTHIALLLLPTISPHISTVCAELMNECTIDQILLPGTEKESAPFSLFLDKIRLNSVILSYIQERGIFCFGAYIIAIHSDKKRRRLIYTITKEEQLPWPKKRCSLLSHSTVFSKLNIPCHGNFFCRRDLMLLRRAINPELP